MECFQIAQLPLQSVHIEEKAPGDYLINLVSSDDTMTFIGNRGEVFWSLQHLIKSLLRAQGLLTEGHHIRVDVDSYRVKQESNVLQRVDQAAQRVLELGQPVFLPPMSPFFRRLCHVHISEKYPQLKTASHGSSNSRAVKIFQDGVVAPAESADYDVYDNLEL